MLMPKADRKKIHEALFREGVLCAEKNFQSDHADLRVKNLFVIKALQSLNSKKHVNTRFNWQWYYYTLTPSGVDYLREWLNLPADIVPQTHIKTQRTNPPPRGLGGDGERRGGGRGERRGGDREGGYRRRFDGEHGDKEGGAPGDYNPSFSGRGGFGRGRGGFGNRDRDGGAGGGQAPAPEQAAPAEDNW